MWPYQEIVIYVSVPASGFVASALCSRQQEKKTLGSFDCDNGTSVESTPIATDFKIRDLKSERIHCFFMMIDVTALVTYRKSLKSLNSF